MNWTLITTYCFAISHHRVRTVRSSTVLVTAAQEAAEMHASATGGAGCDMVLIEEPNNTDNQSSEHTDEHWTSIVAVNLSEHGLAAPCELPLPSRTPRPWCRSKWTKCHFRSCMPCRALCEKSTELQVPSACIQDCFSVALSD